MWRQKGLDAITKEAEQDAKSAGPKLGLLDLLCIGVGSTVGSGVFVLTGEVLPLAGPSASLSWLCAGVVCSLSAFSYVELSRRIPTSGSCYAYSLHALGELGAVVAAVCLTLEYGVSAAGVARSWSSLVAALTGRGDHMFIWYTEVHGENDFYLDWPAGVIMALSVAITSAGLDIGKNLINIFTGAKLALVGVLIICGFCAWDVSVFTSTQAFFPHHFGGTIAGVSSLFFGFIGFDEVCCLSGKAYRPRRSMPIALLGTLLGTTLISSAAQLALSGMVPAGERAQWPIAFERHGWGLTKTISSAGEAVLLPLVVFLSFLPQPELLASMGKDGLVPEFFTVQGRGGAYVAGSLASGAVVVLAAACVPFSVLWGVVSLGVLLSFNLTNTCLIMVRYGNGGKVSQPEVARLLGAFWCAAAPAAYVLWLGVVQPALNSERPSMLVIALSPLMLGVLGYILAAITIRGEQIKEDTLSSDAPDDDGSGFHAPGVPFVPGIAIFLNFMLMATVGFWDLLYLGLLLALSLAAYATGRRDEQGERDSEGPRAPPRVVGKSGRYGHLSEDDGI